MVATKRNDQAREDRIYLIIALAITIIITIYWLALTTHAYRTFLDGTGDLAVYSYSMYFTIHYPNLTSGLQFLVISDHVSPDALLILLIFDLYQSSLTLLYVQVIIICLSSLIVFYIAREVTKNPFIAIMFQLAFLLNPGVTGIMTFDFHMEFLLVPTYLLVFYFYLRSNKKLFAVSLILLLGAIEEAPLLGLTLGLGLLAYELYNVKFKWGSVEKTKKLMLYAILIGSIVTGLFYYGTIRYLSASYSTSYQQLPYILRVTGGSDISLLADLHGFVSNPIRYVESNFSAFSNPFALYILVLAVLMVFIGFGFYTLKNPIITLLLLLPWIIGLLIWPGNLPHFLYQGFQYYSYSLGPTIAAATIGAALVAQKFKKSGKIITPQTLFMGLSVLIIALILMFASLLVAIKPALFLADYEVSVPLPAYNQSQIYPLIRLVPQNASLMTNDVISPHLAERKYIEFTWSYETRYSYFIPDYILVSYTNSTDIYTNGTFDFLTRSLSNHTYELVERNGNARLYERV